DRSPAREPQGERDGALVNKPLSLPDFSLEPLRAVLDRYAGNVALIDEAGRETTYAELLRDADKFSARVGPARQLVFLAAANARASISAYVACLLAGHPVYLFAEGDQLQDPLIERY